MRIFLVILLFAQSLPAQSQSGELHLKVVDPAGLPVKGFVEIVSESNHFRERFAADDGGRVVVKRLPLGVYSIHIQQQGFAAYVGSVEVRSAIPTDFVVRLGLSPVNSSLVVKDSGTLVDPRATGSVEHVGTETLEDRLTSIPSRSLIDVVNSEPGWLYEGNAVLHPRGSEYQTQFVVDGIPLTDNRSPSFGPEIEADDVQSMNVYTANIPAEYGRKMGGVVEVNTQKDSRPGFHGKFVASGGSFDTADAYLDTQYAWGKNTLALTGDGATTQRYLNPPVVQNYTNTGTTSSLAAQYERDLTPNDRLGLMVRREQSEFDVPNEQIQQSTGQLQSRNSFETMGIVSYEHIFSPNVLGDFRGMVRDDSDGFWSNALSTPIIAAQQRGFREGYFKGAISVHRGRHEWKAGIEGDFTRLREEFDYVITDSSQFDPGTPSQFSFPGNQPGLGARFDLEQSAFVQDLIRLGKWTVSAGIRWDHYQLLVNQNAASPRLGIARYVQSADLVLHASFDRVFQTPAFENILLSSSPAVVAVNPNVLRLPVPPSHGDYYEVGLTKGFFQQLKLDANYFMRRVDNFADDDLLLNTSISFPIAFRKGDIYGAEAKIELPHWRGLSGFASYSYMVGSVHLPVTGGLFLGSDATNALNNVNGRLWDSQDQRNTVRTRFRYQLVPRAWVAFGGEYGSGLPVEFDGTEQQAIAQYGQQIVGRVDLAGGRVKPSLSLDASAGTNLWKKDNRALRLQADVQNLNNRLNLINFAGLFSGTSIAPPRSYSLRLEAAF